MQPRISHRPALSLRVDPNFTPSRLPEEARQWYDRLWAGITNPEQLPNATELAASNNLYNYGRGLNTHMTTLLHVFRATGDLRMLDEIDRLAQIMRSKLKDASILKEGGSEYEADGYLNWLYMRDNDYKGTDMHEMDDMMTHSMVASVAWAFYVNRDLDSKYAERATFWTDYLKNHFEAKWRKRKGISGDFPFLTKNLTHVYVQWIRYHYYMFRLTGKPAYYEEASRMAHVIANNIIIVKSSVGEAARWDHGIQEVHGPQRTNYARYTMQGLADLSMENFNMSLSNDFMKKIAATLSFFILRPDEEDPIAYHVDGKGSLTADMYSVSPFSELGYWDNSGRIMVVSEKIFNKLEKNINNPRSIYIPAGIFLSLMRCGESADTRHFKRPGLPASDDKPKKAPPLRAGLVRNQSFISSWCPSGTSGWTLASFRAETSCSWHSEAYQPG
jgi:hypothetical protein